MPCWSHRSEMGVCSRRWSRRMATFSWAVNRLRVFLAMGKPPLEIVAYSSGPFFPFRLKQNTHGRVEAGPCEGVGASSADDHRRSLSGDGEGGLADDSGLGDRAGHRERAILRACRCSVGHTLNLQNASTYLKRQRKKLQDKNLGEERRRALEDTIKEAEASIDNHEYEWVSPFLRGDTTSGIRREANIKGESPADALPPGIEGEGK